MASQQAKKDNTRTFVLEDDNDNSHVIGFYTLTMTPIDLKALPDKLQKTPIVQLWWSDCPSYCR